MIRAVFLCKSFFVHFPTVALDIFEKKLYNIHCCKDVRLAQLDRAFGYGPKGRGFESSSARWLEESGMLIHEYSRYFSFDYINAFKRNL